MAPRSHAIAALVLSLICSNVTGCRSDVPSSAPPATQPARLSTRPAFDLARMADADAAIESAITRGELPGAVLLVGRGDRTGGEIRYRKAYGQRALQPEPRPMAVDTIFDLASLSKPIGCATSIHLLIERGKISLDDPVARHLPEFGQNGKETITIAQLLLHVGGLIADNAMADYRDGPQVAWEKICAMKPTSPPGTKFVYSDVGYIVLGKLVEHVSGLPLDQFAEQEIFEPLQMTTACYNPRQIVADAMTGFHRLLSQLNPPTSQPVAPPATTMPTSQAALANQWLESSIAPTQRRDGRWMVGEVHDPRAYALGGVAGHAGLFGSSRDLARYCRMLLNGGTLDGRRVLKPESVSRMIEPHPLPNAAGLRTYGFDCDTAYSAPRGERFGFERGVSFGHTGFTGTSLWIDPKNDCYVILLTNAVHPDGKGKATALRRLIGTIAGEALLGKAPKTAPSH